MAGVGLPPKASESWPLGPLVRRRSARLAELLRRSGRVGSPGAMAAESIRNTALASLVALPGALVLGAELSPWLFAAALVPAWFAVAPELKLRDQVAQRREGVERELPFFAVLVSVLGSAGVPLYTMFRDITESGPFERIGREALMVKRDVEILGMNANEAFERLAASHPSRRFGDFLLGYTSKARSGGDVPFYLSGESGALLRDLEEGWARYVGRVGIIGSMMITVFGVVPLLLMVVGVFSPGLSIVGLVVFTGLGVPLFTAGLVALAESMQPMKGEAINGRAGVALVIAVAASSLGVVSGLPWVGIAAALLTFFVVYGVSVREQLEETKALDSGVTAFLRELLDYRRQEYDLARAVSAIESGGKFTPAFGRLLARVAAQLKAGVPLDAVRVECRSRLGRLTFFLLGEMSRSGGGTVDTVYQLTSFSDRLAGMRRNAAAEMRPYQILSYLSPLLLAFGVTFVGGVLSSFGARVTPGLSTLHLSGFQMGPVPPGLSQVSSLLIVVSAAALGVIGAKITDLTVRNTLRASVNVGLAVAAIAAMALAGSHSIPPLP